MQENFQLPELEIFQLEEMSQFKRLNQIMTS